MLILNPHCWKIPSKWSLLLSLDGLKFLCREFYSLKASSWMVDDSTPAYLQKVERILDEEKQRVLSYLNHESEKKVLHVVESEMLARKQTELLEKEG